jgi:hypothetical protein
MKATILTATLVFIVLADALAEGACAEGQTADPNQSLTWLANDSQAGPATQSWVKKTDQYGRTSADVTATGQTPDGPTQMTLQADCSTGKGGVANLVLTVVGAAKMKNFGFEDFEGPDAPAMRKPLVTMTVHRPRGDLVTTTAVTGSYTVSDEGFEFNLSLDYNRPSKVTRITDALRQDGTGISVSVRGLKDPKKAINVDFPATGAPTVLGEIMNGCGERR